MKVNNSIVLRNYAYGYQADNLYYASLLQAIMYTGYQCLVFTTGMFVNTTYYPFVDKLIKGK